MKFLTITKMNADPVLAARVGAGAAWSGVRDPQFWAAQNALRIYAVDGWAAAYEASTADNPGGDESAVTDDMIAAAIAQLRAEDEQRARADREAELARIAEDAAAAQAAKQEGDAA